MVTVNVHEAKTNLSRLLAQVEAGRRSSSPATAIPWLVSCGSGLVASGNPTP